jgi:hypothetical protein
MGQQQILLILVVVIIVGLAVAVAINFINKEATYLTYQEYQEVGLEMGTEIEKLALEPAALGGGGGTYTNSWVNFSHFTCPLTVESNDIVCHTPDRTKDYVRFTLRANGDHARIVYEVRSEVMGGGGDNPSPVSGSVTHIIRWRIDRDGVKVDTPYEVLNH